MSASLQLMAHGFRQRWKARLMCCCARRHQQLLADTLASSDQQSHSIKHLLLARLMCCSASTRRLILERSMLFRNPSSCSLGPTSGLSAHSLRPAASASSMGAAGSKVSSHRGEQAVLNGLSAHP